MSNPVSWTEIDCLSKIIALVESRMVGTRECYDEISSLLICPVNLKESGKPLCNVVNNELSEKREITHDYGS